MGYRSLLISVVLLFIAVGNAGSQTNAAPPQWPKALAEQLCAAGGDIAARTRDILGQAPSGIASLKIHLNKPHFFAASGFLKNGHRVDVNARFVGRPNAQTRLSFFAPLNTVAPLNQDATLAPQLLIDLNADCALNRAVFLTYKTDGRLEDRKSVV